MLHLFLFGKYKKGELCMVDIARGDGGTLSTRILPEKGKRGCCSISSLSFICIIVGHPRATS